MVENQIIRENLEGKKKENKLGVKDESIILFAKRVANMGDNSKVPLFERMNFIQIAISNLEEYISTRLVRFEGDKLNAAHNAINAALTEISAVSKNISRVINGLKIKSDDPKVEISISNLVRPDRNLWKIKVGHYYALALNKENIDQYYLIDIGNEYKDIKIPGKYYYAILKFIPNLNYPFISNELNPNSLNEINSTSLIKKNNVIENVFFFSGSDQEYNDILIRVLQEKKLRVFYINMITLECFKAYTNAKNVHPELKFQPIDEKYRKIDYYKELAIKSRKGFLFRTPMESFKHVEDFIDQMCTNPKVEAIYITLYRMADDSNILKSIMKAAQSNKKVFVYIEVNARGNEDANLSAIEILKLMQSKYDVNIICNYLGQKVHGKMFVAVAGSMIFTHTATGNYNEKTARQYIDLHYITNDPAVGSLCLDIMKTITVPAKGEICNRYVANTLEREILKETEAGGRIRIKCNHLNESKIVELLEIAAKRGVKVELIIRTTIGIEETENLKIKSITGRFLEHERIFIFGEDKNARVYIGSSDLLFRNLYKRMETLIPIHLHAIKKRLIDIFDTQMIDRVKHPDEAN